ncbi:hypothetical protein DF3PB_120018 [uncultured Defluviicoccus sp.]|uniref:Uncharacterized protein n=1 Tax=metagenome TaxID=256318 RepID=A0A380TAH1_9ZZZZ|nr:hypothetical protein DF3PB_120018 [uncultured Defluviicoccus sp.]
MFESILLYVWLMAMVALLSWAVANDKRPEEDVFGVIYRMKNTRPSAPAEDATGRVRRGRRRSKRCRRST